ncbi:MAG TPA: MerR family transcriptional regulator [Dehalococcoidia bacterium]|nr:MerR family transcriptional regulator [Dehalococcoidia bacterium]
MNFDESEPCYVISVVARMLGVHAQTLRYYEKAGIIEPSRSRGRVRLYSNRDIDKLRHIRTLMDDLGVNIAGVEVILRLTGRIEAMEKEMEEIEREIRQLMEAGLWPRRMLPGTKQRSQPGRQRQS